MLDIYRRLQNLLPAEKSTVEVPDFMTRAYEAMDDDLNTPIVIATLFEAGKIINSATDGNAKLNAEDLSVCVCCSTQCLLTCLASRQAPMKREPT